MKVLFVTYDEPINIPYIKCYQDAITSVSGTYDCVFWERSGEDASYKSNSYVYKQIYKHVGCWKILNLLGYRKFVLNIFKTEHYDKIVVLTSVPGVMIFDYLIREYKERYWLDIRDYTYEGIPLYKNIINKLVKNSYKTSISSPKFKSFLCYNEKLVQSHNLLNTECECCYHKERHPIVIGYLGGIRYYKQNVNFINSLKNSDDFKIVYYGIEHNGCNLEKYVEENDLRNVSFCGKFNNSDKAEIYKGIDMINCIYGNSTKIEKLALPNKLYDAVLFKKPIIVSSSTYLAEIVKEYQLGIVLETNTNLKKIIKQYLHSMDEEEFSKNCKTFLEKIKSEMYNYYSQINYFVSSI